MVDFSVLDTAFAAVDAQGQTFAMNFANASLTKEVLEAGIVLEIMATAFMVLSGKGKSAVARVISTGITALMIWAVIMSWGSFTTAAPKVADELVQVATNGGTTDGLAKQLLSEYSPIITTLATSILPSTQSTAPGSGSASSGASTAGTSTWDYVKNLGSEVASAFLAVGDALAATGLMAASVAVVVASMAVAWGSLLISNLLIYIGLCFAPLLFALSVVPMLRHLMKNAISFLLGAIFLKPVLAVCINLSLSMVTALSTVTSQTSSNVMPTTVLMFFTLLMSFTALGITMQAPSISSKLFGGVADSLVPDATQTIQQAQGGLKIPFKR